MVGHGHSRPGRSRVSRHPRPTRRLKGYSSSRPDDPIGTGEDARYNGPTPESPPASAPPTEIRTNALPVPLFSGGRPFEQAGAFFAWPSWLFC